MSINTVEPLSPQDYSRGLMVRAVVGAMILVIGIVPMVMSGRDGFWAWFDEPAFGGVSRAIVWLIVMALIEAAIVAGYVLRSGPRVTAWRRQNQPD